MEMDEATPMDLLLASSPPLAEMTDTDTMVDGDEEEQDDSDTPNLPLPSIPAPVPTPVPAPFPVPAPEHLSTVIPLIAAPVVVAAPETPPDLTAASDLMDVAELGGEIKADMNDEEVSDGLGLGAGEDSSGVGGAGAGRGVKREGSTEPEDNLQHPAKRRSDEVEKLWQNVHLNPNDFQAWTLLLQHIDQVNGDDKSDASASSRSDPLGETTANHVHSFTLSGWGFFCQSDLMSGREAYDGFFDRYPYCYGYWKKYADLERRKGTPDTTLKVFERGLEAISLSVDLWLHYLEYITSQFPDIEAYVRQEYERAIETCGLEFKSDKVWEAYIGWESTGKRWKNVTQLYERLLATPTTKYLTHWQKFQEHVRRHLPSEVVGVDEFLSLRREVLASLSRSDVDAPDEAPPGVEAAPGDETVGTNVQDEETKALQKSIIAARQKIHDANITAVKAIWGYEDAIKRPYFHVKPLEKSQLQAWRNYLDYEMKQGDGPRVRVLFERCLIACAFYEEFWMRYIRYLEESGAVEDEVRGVYKRACLIHLREKNRPHLAWAAFEEEKGDSDRAMEILTGVQDRAPGGLEAWVQAAGVERRRERMEDARNTFTRCLDAAKSRQDKAAHSHISMKYSRFLSLFCDAPEDGVEILTTAQEYDKENSSVVLMLVDQLLSCRPPRVNEAAGSLREAVEDVTHQPGTRLIFAHRLFHFLSECGQEASSMSEGLRVLRQVQMEVRQMDSASQGIEADGSGGSGGGGKQGEVVAGGIAVIESRRDKRSSQEKTSPSPVNGSAPPNPSGAPPSSTPPSTAPPGQTMVPGYQGYQQSGYGNYNQGYPQGYGASHYQGWGYPTQQGGYGYGQQGWGTYGNYYGQR